MKDPAQVRTARAGTLNVLSGPAACGKTQRLLDRYFAALSSETAQQRLGTLLWLTPSHRTRQAVRDELTLRGNGIFAPNVYTFEEFAEKLLIYAPDPVTPLNRSTERVLLRRIIHRLLTEGNLTAYRAIAETGGFLDLVAGMIAELKQEEIWPDQFLQACQGFQERSKDQELAAIYHEYQETLTKSKWYDEEGRFWYARQLIEHDHWGPFPRFKLVVLDGFTDFLGTQIEFLKILLNRTDEMVIALPGESEGGKASTRREDLFAKSDRVLSRLRTLGPFTTEWVEKGSLLEKNSLPAGLRHICNDLFLNIRQIQPTSESAGVELWALSGAEGEVRQVTLRVRKLLAAGTQPEEIIVAVRFPADYADLLQEAFEQARTPCFCDVRPALREIPFFRALMQVINLIREDWEWSALTCTLRNLFVQPVWLRAGQTAREINTFLQRHHLPEGREEILERLLESSTHAEDPSEQANLQRLSQELQHLSETITPGKRNQTWREWMTWIQKILEELRISPVHDVACGRGESDSTAWNAWKVFNAALERIASNLDTVEHGTATLSLDQFFDELQDLAAEISIPSDVPERGRVRVLEVSQVRNLDVPYLFILGLTEESFPTRSGENCLYGEDERRELHANGLGLVLREQRLQDEMLLFYGVVTRARKHLVLSYPQIDRRGETLTASPYYDAVRDLFVPKSLPTLQQGHLHPIPQRAEILGGRDLRLVAMSEALLGDGGLLQGLALKPGEDEIRRNLAAAVEMNLARFHTRGWTSYEAVLSHPENKSYLQENYGEAREFSATELEEYATCPFRYWVSHFLGLSAVEPPEIRTDPRQRGSLLHDVLSLLHRNLQGEATQLPPAEFRKEVQKQFVRLLEQFWEGRPVRGDFSQALREIERTIMAEWAQEYGQQLGIYEEMSQAQVGGKLRPLHLEIGFGHGRGEEANHPPLILTSGTAVTRIAGRIDRVDVHETPQGNIFSIIDYKTGKAPTFKAKDVQAGRALQLAIYALAVEQLGLAGDGAVLGQAGYWSLRDQGFDPAADAPTLEGNIRKAGADWQKLIDLAVKIVPQLVQGIRAGEFPPANPDEKCGAACSFKTICRVGQIRPLSESLAKTWFPDRESRPPPEK
ncbi:MAG: PD-(D/E)XK nuclease family protein [Planctomycetales bacterium]